MAEKQIVVGCIVTDMDGDSSFLNKQGVVHKIEGGVVTVRFDCDMYPYMRTYEVIEKRWIDIDYDDPKYLRCDTEWSVDNQVKALFGYQNCSLIRTLKNPIDPNQPCMVNACDGKQTHVMWWNCWGTVSQVYVCEAHHKEHNGRSSDSFPYRE